MDQLVILFLTFCCILLKDPVVVIMCFFGCPVSIPISFSNRTAIGGVASPCGMPWSRTSGGGLPSSQGGSLTQAQLINFLSCSGTLYLDWIQARMTKGIGTHYSQVLVSDRSDKQSPFLDPWSCFGPSSSQALVSGLPVRPVSHPVSLL